MYFEVLPEIGGERYGNYLKNCKNDVLQERNGHFEILSLVYNLNVLSIYVLLRGSNLIVCVITTHIRLQQAECRKHNLHFPTAMF